MSDIIEPDEINIIEVVQEAAPEEEAVETVEPVSTGPKPFEGAIAIGCNVNYFGKNYTFAKPVDSIAYDEDGIIIVNNIPYSEWSETEINDAKE